jgi:hypothetical protein
MTVLELETGQHNHLGEYRRSSSKGHVSYQDIFVLPETLSSGGVFVGFDTRTHPNLIQDDFADELAEVLGVETEPRVNLPLSRVSDEKIVSPFEEENAQSIELSGFGAVVLKDVHGLGINETLAIADVLAERVDTEEIEVRIRNYTDEDSTGSMIFDEGNEQPVQSTRLFEHSPHQNEVRQTRRQVLSSFIGRITFTS